MEPSFSEKLPDSFGTPFEEAIKEEDRMQVSRILSGMDEMHRQILCLHLIDELSFPKVGLQVGKTDHTTYFHFQKAKGIFEQRFKMLNLDSVGG